MGDQSINSLPSVTSTTSKNKAGGGRRLRRAFNIEEIFTSISSIQASSLAAPPARVTLSPRSAEACLKHGVNPEILRIRDLDSFWEMGIDPAIQRMRHEAYSQRRHDMIRLCRMERKRLLTIEQQERETAQGIGGAVPTGPSAAEVIMAEQAKLSVAAIELERKRLEKMKLKQEKEIEQVVAFEAKMTELQVELNRKREAEQRKAEARERARQKRLREAAEERRIKELRKKAREDAEEERRIKMAREMFRRDKELQKEREAMERRARIEAQQREEERLRKADEHRLQTQKIMAEQQAMIRRKMEEMEEAERIRQAKVQAKLEEEHRKMSEQRRQIEMRLEANLEMAKQVEEKRKEDFYIKQKEHEDLRAEFLEEQRQQQELYHQQQALLENKRLLILRQTKEEEELRKQMMLDKFVQDEEHVQAINQVRDREHMLQREKKHLKLTLKKENVERVKRIKEYKRMEMLKKIHEAEKRMEFMFQQKQQITAQRKKTAVQTKIQRDNLMKLVEKAKTCTGEDGVKSIQKSINAQLKMGIEGASKGGSGNKKGRAAHNKAVKRSNSSTSAAAGSSGYLGPPPEAPTLLKRLSQEEADAANFSSSKLSIPSAYVSPYESNDCTPSAAAGKLPTTMTF